VVDGFDYKYIRGMISREGGGPRPEEVLRNGMTVYFSL
jgi:hypothetical protein